MSSDPHALTTIEQVRAIIGDDRFIEVYCSASLEACQARDKTGLYEDASQGQLRNVTGIDAPYEL